jgi:uncharacterized membrane protein YvbJ
MAVTKCPGCGSDLNSDQKECPYCGAKNPGYAEPKPAVEKHIVKESVVEPAEKKISWGVFILLIFLFWPAAIVYAIVKLSK